MSKKRICIVFAIIFIALFTLVNLFDNDKVMNIKYRIYTKESGWSSWCKNGTTCGNKKDKIKGIQINTSESNPIIYDYYTLDKEWDNSFTSNGNKTEDDDIYGIKMSLYHGTSKYYDICYRTYNNKNEWLEWNCTNEMISGNKDIPISAIEIKIIPDDVVKSDYLKNYNFSENESSIGF